MSFHTKLQHQRQLARLHKIPGFQLIEIYATGEISRLPLHFVHAGGELSVKQSGNELPECVVNLMRCGLLSPRFRSASKN